MRFDEMMRNDRHPFRFGAAAAVILAGLLAGCQSEDGPKIAVAPIDASAGSEANIGSLTAAIQQNPQDATAYNVRGTAYGKAGRLQDALSDFTTAIRLNPSSIRPTTTAA